MCLARQPRRASLSPHCTLHIAHCVSGRRKLQVLHFTLSPPGRRISCFLSTAIASEIYRQTRSSVFNNQATTIDGHSAARISHYSRNGYTLEPSHLVAQATTASTTAHSTDSSLQQATRPSVICILGFAGEVTFCRTFTRSLNLKFFLCSRLSVSVSRIETLALWPYF